MMLPALLVFTTDPALAEAEAKVTGEAKIMTTW